MRRYYLKLMTLAAMTSAGGALAIFGCSPVPALINGITSVNPCGTIFQCDPREYAYITESTGLPGVQPDYDIFCSYPPFCTQAQDPIAGGLFADANP